MTTLDYPSLPFNIGDIPSNYAAHIVGGTVRDLMLGKKPVDYDISILGNPEEFAAKVANSIRGRFVLMGKAGKSVCRVVTKKTVFDITSFRGTTIESDLRKRDFTINAMAFDIFSGQLVDPLNGCSDLSSKQIRLVSNSAFRDDPIRLLRAHRMAATLGFSITQDTIFQLKQDVALIQLTAGERVREELFKIFDTPKSFEQLLAMRDNGLLFQILPELSEMRGCHQNRYHLHDVFDHTLSAYANLEQWFMNPTEIMGIIDKSLNFPLASKKIRLTKFCILLHDIGKPDTSSKDLEGGIHFHGHEAIGTEKSTSICQRLRCSIKEQQFVSSIISLHSRPLHLFHLHNKGVLGNRAIARLFMASGENLPYLLLHAGADRLGKTKDDGDQAIFISFLRDLFVKYVSDYRIKKATPPLISGIDLIEKFGLKPSPVFKRILQEVEETRLSEEQMDKEKALELVERLLRGV